MANNGPDLDFLHPIISIMAQHAANDKARKDRELDKQKQAEIERSNKEREKQNQDELKQRKEAADHAYDLDKIRSEYERERNYQEALKTGVDLSSKGVDLNQFSSDRNIPSELQIPEDNSFIQLPGSNVRIPKGAIPDYRKFQEIAGAGARTQAYNTTLGREEASAPFDAAKDERQAKIKKDLQDSDNAFTLRVENLRRDGRLDEAQKEIDAREKISKRSDATDRYIADLSARTKLSSLDMFEEDDHRIANAINDVYITGNTKETSIPAKLRMGIKGAVPKGWTPLTPKDDEVFSSVQGIGNVLNDARTLAEINSIGTKGGAISWTGIGDAAAIKNRLKGRAGELAKYFGKEIGVKTQQDIQRALDAVNSPLSTQKQNMDNVNELQSVLDKAANIVLSKYAPDQAKAVLAKRGIDGSKYFGEDNSDNGVEDYERGPDGKLRPVKK